MTEKADVVPASGTVLLFSYHFPPIGGAGAQRPARFARYLPDLGWRVHVLTSPGTAEGRWTPKDATLAEEVPENTPVTRTSQEPAPATLWEDRRHRWLLTTSRWRAWWSAAPVAAGQSIRDVAAIWTIMPPYDSAWPSRELAHRLDVPWIADLGDPWAFDEMTIYPTALHRAAARRDMRRALKSAAAIVMSTPEAANRVRAEFPELCDRPIVAIPNGYDASDFVDPPPERANGIFRIVHSGYLHTQLGLDQRRTAKLQRVLRGQVVGVDVLARSHFYLVQAVERLLEEDPSLRERLEVVFAGVLSVPDRQIAERLSVVSLPGYLSHAESVRLIRGADLLFLPMQKVATGMRATIVPGKTYEYLASGRPILAAVPDGDARDLVRAAGTGLVCDPDDVAAMAAIVRAQIERGDAPTAVGNVGAYEYRQLVRRVADLLTKVTSG